MSDNADKTEEPTDKKLKDARDKGDVAKSKDVTSAAGLLAWLVLAPGSVPWAASQCLALHDVMLRALSRPFADTAPMLGMQALHTLLALTAAALLPPAAIGSLIEFLQAGPVFSMEKLSFKFETLNPAQGLQRMLSIDKCIDVVKSVFKAAVLLAIGALAIRALLPPLMPVFWTDQPGLLGALYWHAAKLVLGGGAALIAAMAVLDAVHQRHRFIEKMRVSKHEIQQEHKDQNGDPLVKGVLRHLQMTLALSDPVNASRGAAAVITNPTHITIAIHHDRDAHPVPVVAAMGTGDLARVMREAAEDAGVPTVCNIPLARQLWKRAEVGEVVPAEFFEVIAEVILWAQQMREASGDAAGDGPLMRT
jgi:flagellar biosynthesis protein FlhB